MSLKQASQSLFWGLLTVGTLSAPTMAQVSMQTTGPIRQPSAFEAIDQTIKSNAFWSEMSISEDAKSFFVIGRDEKRIEKRSKNFETLYLDLVKQQDEGQAIIRTQDISNLYSTSLLELQQQ